MKIGAVSERTGLSAHTIRYYEKQGLIRKASKDQSGHRDYSAQDVELLNWISCLKKSAMPLKKIQRYVRVFNYDSAETLCLLEEHLQRLITQQADINHYIDVTKQKIARLKTA